MTIAQLNGTASEFVLFHGGLNVNEGLVFGVAENGSIRNRQSVGDSASIDGCGHVHVLLQSLTWILRGDARLKSACGGIKRRGNVGNSAVKNVRISVGGDFHSVSGTDE